MKQFIVLLVLISNLPYGYAQIYNGNKGKVELHGEAPLEIITAKSNSLQGKIDAATRKFNFRQNLNTFSFSQGDMQKKDAEEDYWETNKYQYASFKGIIINDINLNQNGEYHVTAKGAFTMHGVSKNVKINGVLSVKEGRIVLSSTFKIYLTDYGIKVPRLMVMKVSEEFKVDLTLNLSQSKS